MRSGEIIIMEGIDLDIRMDRRSIDEMNRKFEIFKKKDFT